MPIQSASVASVAAERPLLFLNCRKVVGALPFDAFKPIVEDEMKRAEGLLQGGAKLDAGFYDKVCEENQILG